MKHIKSILLRVGVSVLSLGLLTFVVRDKFFEAIKHLSNIQYGMIVFAVCLCFLSIVPVSFRTRRILNIQNIQTTFSRIYYLWTISLFFNLFLPSAVGGDIVKAYYVYKDSGKKMASITSILFDRFFGLLATISIGAGAFLVGREAIEDPKIGHILFWMSLVVFALVLFIMSKRFSRPMQHFINMITPKRFYERLERFFEIMNLYRAHRTNFFISWALSLLAQGLYIVMMYVLALSINIQLPWAVFFLYFPIIAVCSMVPSVGGLGVREAMTVYLFQKHIPMEQAVAYSILADLFVYGVGIACGILYLVRGGASIREIEQIETAV